MHWLLEPLQYGFMLRGLAAALTVGLTCAIIGCFVVLRGMAFYGDALAHAILPGVAIGYLLGHGDRRPLFWWGMAAALLSAFGIGTLSRRTRIKQDTAIGVTFAAMFALGIALISTVRDYSLDLTHFLFGDVLSVGGSDLLLIVLFSLLVIALVFLFYKEFLLLSFDPVYARTVRLPWRLLDTLLLALIALTIMVSLQTVGIALMVAMLVTPAAGAWLLCSRLPTMMLLSGVLAAVSSICGLYLSYYAGIASGPSIVLVATAGFGLCWLLATLRRRGIATRVKKNPA